jgi:DNA-binding response OmpR family regulator
MVNIIIQEVDKGILDVLKITLEEEGFEVFCALGYDHDFMKLIDEIRPHVVVLDYILDGLASIQICRNIHEKHPHLPVIALSCNSNISDEYCQNGFADYIEKPFDLDLLYKILRKHIPT